MSFDMWNADRIGHFGGNTRCKHNSTNYKVLEIAHRRIHFKNRFLGRMLRPLSDALGYTAIGDTFDHHMIFIDVRCSICKKQAVATL